jgi:regulator of RNase E activity RraA
LTEPLADLPQSVVDLLRQVSTATLTTQLLRRGLGNTFIRGLTAFSPDQRMVGEAFTLRYAPTREDVGGHEYDNDTDVQRLAVEAIGPGQVLVIDARGEVRSASLGNILATRIARRGAAGIVSDGAFRDTSGFADIGIPSYAAAAHATASSVHHYPVDMNVPIGCGGVLVMPGDFVVGDAEGVVVIPRAMAPSVAQGAYEQEKLEEWILAEVEAGASIRGLYPPAEETLARYRAETPQPASHLNC